MRSSAIRPTVSVISTGGGNGIASTTYTGTTIGDDAPFDPMPWVRHAGDKPIVLFGADHYKERLPPGGRFIAWDKSCGMGPAAQFSDAEFAWTNRRNPRAIFRHFWMGAMRGGDPVANSRNRRLHVSQKPVELMAWCLDHARVGLGKRVLDPYMGSGSTGMACMMTGRQFLDGLYPDAFLVLAEVVFEVNLDFFAHQVLPAWTTTMTRLTAAMAPAGAQSSPGSPEEGTASPPALI